jgi:hypothetical protein
VAGLNVDVVVMAFMAAVVPVHMSMVMLSLRRLVAILENLSGKQRRHMARGYRP